jgi:hypothetical protein
LFIEPQSVEELAEMVEQYGLERMTAIAALLLESRVSLSDSRLTNDERIAVLDSALALLPYGYRTVMSVSTGMDRTVQHRIDLTFAGYSDNQVEVSFANSAPIPMPSSEHGHDYLRLLRESIQSIGIQPVVQHLWDAKSAFRVKRKYDAFALLARLGVTAPVSRAIRQNAADAAQIAAVADAHEPVLFGTSYPSALRFGVRQPLYVHIYREGIRNQLDERVAELAGQLGSQRSGSETPANTIIPQGAKLEIQPLIANVRSYPARKTVTWHDKFSEAPFEIECINRKYSEVP